MEPEREEKMSNKRCAEDEYRVTGSALDALGLDRQAALELKLKAELHQRILQLVKRRGYRARISLSRASSMGAVCGCIGPSARTERGPQDDKRKSLYRSDELLRHPKASRNGYSVGHWGEILVDVMSR